MLEDAQSEGCLMMIPTEECIYSVILFHEDTSAIRFLNPITLEKIGIPDLNFDTLLRNICILNSKYIVAGDEKGTLSFISCLTKKVESVFSIKQSEENDISINEFKVLPGRL